MIGKILFMLAISASVMMTNPTEASSRTRSAYCMQGPSSPALSNCTFTSMAQCRATASGRRMICIANPFYNGRRSSAPLPTITAKRPDYEVFAAEGPAQVGFEKTDTEGVTFEHQVIEGAGR